MAEIILNFIYNNHELKIPAKRNEFMKDIFKRYIIKIEKNINDIYFLYNGNKINDEIKLEEINNLDNNINILVYEYMDIDENENKYTIKHSKDIICPICSENCLISIEDYKIKLNQCDNEHQMPNLLLDEFNDSQKIDESKIICHDCKKNKLEIYDNKLFKCCECNYNLCPLCITKHNKEHITIDYDYKKYLCNIHGERYTSYCKECHKNLCDLCEFKHNKEHKFIYHRQIIENDNCLIKLKDLKKQIDSFKKEIHDIINKLNKVVKNFEIYYNISSNIINNYTIKNKNYQILMNINNLNVQNEIIIKEIANILNENKIENKIKEIDEIYEKMITRNEITMQYKIENEGNIRIFGDTFVKNNKNNCHLIIGHKKYDLCSFLNIKDFEIDNDINEIIEIKLKEINNITNMRSMFKDCISLLSLPDIHKLNTCNIIDISFLFSKCSSLKLISDISNWNVNKITNISCMFQGCLSLKSLPDISKWNIKNVKYMNSLFNNCPLLTVLPDISHWDTSNVIDMHMLFNKCSSLLKVLLICFQSSTNVHHL